MLKPLHAIETTRYWGLVTETKSYGVTSDDPRAVALRLVSRERRLSSLTQAELEGAPFVLLTLALQRVPAAQCADSSLRDALACWLVARGERSLNIESDEGTSVVKAPIDVCELGHLGRIRSSKTRPEALRVVSLAPSNLDILVALGAGAMVVGCENSSREWVEQQSNIIEILGPDLAPDLDRVAALKPDLVLSSLTVPGMERVVTGLASRGVAQLVLAPRSVNDAIADVERVGVALGIEERAAQVAKTMRDEREALLRVTGPRARVYLEWWPRPHYTPGSSCFSNELIELAGGENVFGDRAGSSIEVSAGEIADARPDLAFVSWCGVDVAKIDTQRLRSAPSLATLSMTKHGRIYPLDERFAGRPGPAMLEAARVMQRHIQVWREELHATVGAEKC